VSKVGVTPLIRVTFSEPVTGVSAASLSLPGVSSQVVVLDQTHATIRPSTPLTLGGSYGLILSSAIHDLSGNSAVAAGPVITVDAQADDRSPAISYAGPWRNMASSNAIGGSFHGTSPTTANPTSGTVWTFGSGVLVTGCMGPNNGVLKVYVDGVLKATRDTYRNFSGCSVHLVRVTGLTKQAHRVQLRATGSRNPVSKGTNVALDAVTALP
jgi:hypothetical protein